MQQIFLLSAAICIFISRQSGPGNLNQYPASSNSATQKHFNVDIAINMQKTHTCLLAHICSINLRRFLLWVFTFLLLNFLMLQLFSISANIRLFFTVYQHFPSLNLQLKSYVEIPQHCFKTSLFHVQPYSGRGRFFFSSQFLSNSGNRGVLSLHKVYVNIWFQLYTI